MPDSESLLGFLDRLNAGADSAAAELYTRYVDRLCQLAARQTGERLKSQYAPEDAAHSALASFFRGMNRGRYQFDSSGRLWALLRTIMLHKIQDRGHKAREDALAIDLPDSEPPHEAVVELADAVEAAMAGLKPRHVDICRLWYMEGLSAPEIAERTGCARQTAGRVLKRFQSQLRRRLGDNSEK